MKTKSFILFVFAVAFSGQAESLNNGLGFAAGMLSGIGISYRHMGEQWGVQTTFGMLSTQTEGYDYPYLPEPYDDYRGDAYQQTYTIQSDGRDWSGSLGVLLLRQLHQAEGSRFYVFFGASTFINAARYKETLYRYECTETDGCYTAKVRGPRTVKEFDRTLCVGAGLGIEYFLTENIHISVEWPLAFTSDGDFYMYIPQVGVHYFF